MESAEEIIDEPPPPPVEKPVVPIPSPVETADFSQNKSVSIEGKVIVPSSISPRSITP